MPACTANRMNLRLLMREPAPGARALAGRINERLLDFYSRKWMFDEESRSYHMTEAGFVDCRRRGHLDSDRHRCSGAGLACGRRATTGGRGTQTRRGSLG
jgi:hypothetical protein